MFASPTETDIAPSWTLLGLLQRGRGDGWLHALAAPRAEAVAALEHCVLHDPRADWQLERRSLYYARLYLELGADLRPIAEHLFDAEDATRSDEERTGLALSVLGHLATYGRGHALKLLRGYAVRGANWRWALDELAVRDSDAGLRALGPRILDRFPTTEEGEAALASAVRDSFEPRPWRIWAEDPDRPAQRKRLTAALEQGDFDRWQRQLRPSGPRPGWSVASVLDWARDGYEQSPRQWREAPAARCLAAVAGPEDRPALLAAAAGGHPAARAAALRHLADRADPRALALIEAATASPDPDLRRAALTAFSRMDGAATLAQAREWAVRGDELGTTAAALLARRGTATDAPRVLAALHRAARTGGADSRELRPLVEGVGRLCVTAAVPVLRHLYRETPSSQLRCHAARALAATDPHFTNGLAVECLWDCEEETRQLGAESVPTGDARVMERMHSLARDPAEQAGVISAVRGRLGRPRDRNEPAG
ncbi:HEAT repeat domain-containing protein [Streptomyces sp. 3MP-14]|uniref:HEAT repeat domain-containing protein n=1 Tax=Streptomyces mimosae TaxID=2586635 RepID=A0A5N6A3J9_9ACTN|nr:MULTISPECIES: HEAT repeat domain-containing protein [Streptomyces]KAB8161958.1 HEAT repeat domain-containing protein [Streptomyces mimosae]KAB8173656.1 HEAT repeat domain-containing protein [Streptomyces sp. 3MP-14]